MDMGKILCSAKNVRTMFILGGNLKLILLEYVLKNGDGSIC